MATIDSDDTTVARKAQRTLTALAWMMGALVSFSLVAIAGREVGKSMSTIEIMFWRSLVSLPLIALVVGLTQQGFRQLVTRRLSLHVARGTVHFAAQYSWLAALMLIPLAELFALEFTAPLWVALLAPLLVGEPLTRTRLIAAAAGFVGTLIVIQPGSTTLNLGTVLALASALGFALSMIATKRLVGTESVPAILFYMIALQFVMASLLAAASLRLPVGLEWAYLVAIAVAGLTAHYALTQAFTLADAMIVAPMDFFRLPMIAALAALIYGEPMEFAVIVGGLVIVAANVFNLYAERRRQRAP